MNEDSVLEPRLVSFFALKLSGKAGEEWKAMPIAEKKPYLQNARRLLMAERRFLAKLAEENGSATSQTTRASKAAERTPEIEQF